MRKTRMKSIEENHAYQYLDNLEMSNFDHSIDEDLEEKLKANNLYADYTGWNFHGTIYWDKQKKKFVCEVRQYHSWIDTIKADTLQGIMDEVCAKYGDE